MHTQVLFDHVMCPGRCAGQLHPEQSVHAKSTLAYAGKQGGTLQRAQQAMPTLLITCDSAVLHDRKRQAQMGLHNAVKHCVMFVCVGGTVCHAELW